MSTSSSSTTTTGSWSDAEKAHKLELLRAALPACQPQEGSPANTFTEAELEALKKQMLEMNIGPRDEKFNALVANHQNNSNNNTDAGMLNVFDVTQWKAPPQDDNAQNGQEEEEEEEEPTTALCNNQDDDATVEKGDSWFRRPDIPEMGETQLFRQEVRRGLFTKPTNAKCPGYMQCNLVVLPQGPFAFDFLLFCQRNRKACPLVDVCEGLPFPNGVARGADLRTDVPRYAIYKDGQLIKEVTDATEYWPENAICFLIGCSFSYDGALIKAGIPLKSADAGRNVPMYKTSLKCRPAGRLHGNMVVSMKPIKAIDVAREVEITAQFPHAHGGPVCVGRPEAIGISNLDAPDWGDSIDIADDEVPVFHACGVTPQSVLMDSKVPFAITHSPGHMFVTDLPSDAVPQI